MFWSIISDYDLRTGLCELIDNALDSWVVGGEKTRLTIDVGLDPARQLISVTDNAGGVKQSDLRLLIAPGGSLNDPNAEIIGIFGVGGKRAGIALGERVQIRSRFKNEDSFEIDISKEWLETPDWSLNYYRVPGIQPRTTEVEISHLRKFFTAGDVDAIRKHLGEIYGCFLRRNCTIKLNGRAIIAHSFENWAYPPEGRPQSAHFDAEIATGKRVDVNITGGLIRDRIPEAENYGVYFYCNQRLVAKELKVREVGYFVTSEAGVPHPDASLCRVIVQLQGPAQLMPWNSSKSAINFDHEVFRYIRPTLIQLTSHFSSLSRRLKDDWDRKVFRFSSGDIIEVQPEDATVRNPLILPPLPHVNKPHIEKLKTRNKARIQAQPWTLGLVEAMAAVEVLVRQRFETKNRIALMLLDSNFEIALKEFIVHRSDLFPPNQFGNAVIQKLFERRPDVIAAITNKVPLSPALLSKVQHYYNIRNKLVHERATVEPTDNDVNSYRLTIESVLNTLFGLKF